MCFDVHVFECECMLFLFRCDDNLVCTSVGAKYMELYYII